MENSINSNSHIWAFSRVGGVNRVNLESGNDLIHLDQLDQKLWTALSCPVNGLELDSKTLELIDGDKDGKIRAPELIVAVKWITSLLNNPDDLLRTPKELPLSAINDRTTEGKSLLASAKQILINIGKPQASTISVEDTSNTTKIYETTRFNGDGIITVNSTDKTDLKNLIADISACSTPVIDRSGLSGINLSLIEEFYKNCSDYSEWRAVAENNMAAILPFGENTENALEIFNAVKNKIDDYFIRCRLADYDINSVDILNLRKASYEMISPKDLSLCISEISTYPLSIIEAHKPLTFEKNINPAWEAAITNLIKNIIVPVFGNKEKLTDAEWKTISAKFDEFKKWKAAKKGEKVEKLGLNRVREILKENKKADLNYLIEQDLEQEDEVRCFGLVDKMVRFHRDIFTLLKNYVSFVDFYSPTGNAIFQAGTLYIDQRSCDLCMKVNDLPKHGTMAHLSSIYLLYCECVSKSKNEKMTIVAALTDGDVDNLMVGRNALFYDRKGNDWDATIVKIIENPISIRQAFWAPYRKIAKLIGDQIQKMASAREAQIQAKATEKVELTSANIDAQQKDTVKQPFDMGKFVGIFAAIGLAIGAIGTALASLIAGFANLEWWKIPISILGVMLLFSGPSMLLAWFKLRKRNLAPVLDSNGWAINANVNVNIPFGKTLTQLATLPKNSRLYLQDPYAKKKRSGWFVLIVGVVVLAITVFLLWHFGVLTKWGIL